MFVGRCVSEHSPRLRCCQPGRRDMGETRLRHGARAGEGDTGAAVALTQEDPSPTGVVRAQGGERPEHASPRRGLCAWRAGLGLPVRIWMRGLIFLKPGHGAPDETHCLPVAFRTRK